MKRFTLSGGVISPNRKVDLQVDKTHHPLASTPFFMVLAEVTIIPIFDTGQRDHRARQAARDQNIAGGTKQTSAQYGGGKQS